STWATASELAETSVGAGPPRCPASAPAPHPPLAQPARRIAAARTAQVDRLIFPLPFFARRGETSTAGRDPSSPSSNETAVDCRSGLPDRTQEGGPPPRPFFIFTTYDRGDQAILWRAAQGRCGCAGPIAWTWRLPVPARRARGGRAA